MSENTAPVEAPVEEAPAKKSAKKAAPKPAKRSQMLKHYQAVLDRRKAK